MNSEYSVARDPLFLAAVGVFAILTTVIPAFFGQAFLLILLQSVTLTILLGVALRTGSAGGADAMGVTLRMLVLWVLTQALVIGWVAYAAGDRIDGAIRDGFDLSTSTLEWLYTDVAYPGTEQTTPLARLIAFLAVTAGSYVSGGLIGIWTLLQTVNQTAFVSGKLLANLDQGVFALVVFFPWAMLRIAAFIGFVALFAEPMWTGNWSPARIWTQRRTLLLASLGMLILALLLEYMLPGPWRSLFVNG